MSDMPNENELEDALVWAAKQSPPLLPAGSMFPMFSAKTTCDTYGSVLVVRHANGTYEILKPTDFAITFNKKEEG